MRLASLERLNFLAASPGATRSPHAAPSRQGQSVARIMLLAIRGVAFSALEDF
jgi:hypothetical protein